MPSTHRGLTGEQSRYLSAALVGDSRGCTKMIDTLLERGVPVLAAYLKLLVPVQQRLGQLWMDGDIDVAEEHLATAIGLLQMDRLRVLMHPSEPSGFHITIATVDGDYHSLGARLVADFFLADGWAVTFLGASVPPADLAHFVASHPVDVVGLSAGSEGALSRIMPTVRALKALEAPPHILLGGPALSGDPEEATAYGVDGVVTDAAHAVVLARTLVGAVSLPVHFDEYLAQVGSRLQTLRAQRAWNQERLAEASGLDRTYISAVENGKQNLTLKALVALATALGVPAERLLSERG